MRHVKDPKVSIITPTYNRSTVLPRAIKSVLKQSFKNFELIIVDDGSTDNTKQVVEEFLKHDNRIKYKRQKNKGAGTARNLGIQKSKGKYITFLDSDDEYLPNNLETRLRVRKKVSNNYGVIYNQFIAKTSSGDKIMPSRGLRKGESLIRYLFYYNQIVQTNSLFISKKLIDKHNLYFDEKLNKHDDWNIVMELDKVTNFYFLEQPLSIWHCAENNIKHRGSQESEKSVVRIINKHKDLFERERDVLSMFYKKIGNGYLLKYKKPNKARAYYSKAIRNYPLYPKNYLLLLLSFFPLNLLYIIKN